MKISDSISKTVKTVEPTGQGLSLYSCGPTVYDHAHIGNLRTFILDDVLRRSLYQEYGNRFHAVMNITDIDDKTIKRAIDENQGESIEEALKRTTRHYESLFLQDLEKVGVELEIVSLVRATESIEAMQQLVREIYVNKLAYVSDGSVYFDVAGYINSGHDYGVLVNVDFDSQSRIDHDEYDKQQARDFVLWKGRKSGEPSWDFELDGQLLPGRPGWHLECSAMADDNLGTPISLHSGGVDLKFPHHENELAQTQAALGHPLTESFIHYGHLFVDGRKMSKSLGNFYRLQDIIDHGFDPLAFRVLVLQSHYSSELNFTWDGLAAAQNLLLDLRAAADLIWQDAAPGSGSTASADKIQTALADNLNTPQALAALVETLQTKIEPTALPAFLVSADELLGLGLSGRPDITPEQKQLISDRERLRADKDFAGSDRLRDELASQGLQIEDTDNGPRWRRSV